MLVSFIILPLTLIFATDEPFRGIGGSPGFFNPFTDADGNTVSAIFVLSAIRWGLGAFGSHRVLQRFMAIESEEKLNSSRNIGMIWLFSSSHSVSCWGSWHALHWLRWA